MFRRRGDDQDAGADAAPVPGWTGQAPARASFYDQWDSDLKTAKTNDFADRRSTAAEAKAAQLRAYRAKMEADEPARLARQKELEAIATAREERREQRDRLKAEARRQQQEEKRLAAEAAAYEDAANVAARAQAEAQKKADSMISRVVKDEAARKAERDRRYANRKARQR